MLAAGYALVSQSATGDKQAGSTFTQVFSGTRVALDALRASVQAAGARVDMTAEAGLAKLSVTWVSSPPAGMDPTANPQATAAAEVPTDRWSLDTEPVQISVWRNPGLDAEANAYTAGGAFPTEHGRYRKQIEEAVAAGDAYPFSETAQPLGYQVYLALIRGEEYWETDRPTLSLSRTYSLNYSGPALALSLKTRVYTRDALIRDFSIPSAVASKIPTDPTTPAIASDQVWGWHQRRQSDQYNIGTRRTEESRSWGFAAWSRAFYEVIT